MWNINFPIEGVTYASEEMSARYLKQNAWHESTAGELLRTTALRIPKSVALISARYRSLALTAGDESVRASILAATACAFREALLGTTTNAINALMNTTPPTTPKTTTRRSAFLARAAIHR